MKSEHNPGDARVHIERALVLVRDGKLAEAQAHCAKALRHTPNHIGALHLSGVIACQSGQNQRGLELLAKAIGLNPNVPEILNDHGTALRMLRRWDEALVSFDRAIALRCDYAIAHNNRAQVLRALGRLVEAIASYDTTIELEPTLAEAYFNRGNIFQSLGRNSEAVADFDKTIEMRPHESVVHYNRGNALSQLERHDEAIGAYDKAIHLKPDFAEAYSNRGNALRAAKRLDEAIASFDKAIQLRPDRALVHYSRGGALYQLKRLDEAVAAYDQVLSIKHDSSEAWLARGNALFDLRRYHEALASHDKALSICPDLAQAWLGRGYACFELNLTDESVQAFERAASLMPKSINERLSACVAELPVIYRSEAEIHYRRSAYEKKLRELHDDLHKAEFEGRFVETISKPPFYLAYQGFNDRDLQTLYGTIASRIVERKYQPEMPVAARVEEGEPIRVGIVSEFFHGHSNWNIPIKGWISQINRDRFRVYGYHLGSRRDQATENAEKMCDRFVQRSLDTLGWCREIQSDAPHVLIYPGLSMDALSMELAALRLAPVQCTSWGHPQTSGLPTIDYFLSSDGMEPEDAQTFYSERLVRLPNLSIFYEELSAPIEQCTREELGLRKSATIFWSGQSLYKYLPQYDDVFARIAKAVPDSQFVFIVHQGDQQVTDVFRSRLEQSFSDAGLNGADHCVFIKRMYFSKFQAAMGTADVFMDSIGWSGCNSTFESLVHNLPIITMPGKTMRSRHTMAILKMMDVTDTIASDIDDYVEIAIKLGSDRDLRERLSEKVARNKRKVYRDRSCIVALEDFLERAVRDRAGEELA